MCTIIRAVLCIAILNTSLPTRAATPIDGATAQNPIFGGLGIEFSHVVDPNLLGAEYAFEMQPHFAFANNRVPTLPALVDLPMNRATTLPWRRFLGATLPRPLRDMPSDIYMMLSDAGTTNRIVAIVEYQGCDRHFEWMTRTLAKKYDIDGSPDVLVSQAQSNRGVEQTIRISFSSIQIDVSCGRELIIDYAHYERLSAWLLNRQRQLSQHEFELRELATRQLVLDRQRAAGFADSFTLGDQFRLQGAFGIAFTRPFAEKSEQNFPFDEPFYADLPNLPDEFASGDIKIEISPERLPITIRGRFENVSFERIQKALQAKYGSPFKSTRRHIIYKVSGNHVVVRRKDPGIELTFIDALQQEAQRKRRWLAESEGL